MLEDQWDKSDFDTLPQLVCGGGKIVLISRNEREERERELKGWRNTWAQKGGRAIGRGWDSDVRKKGKAISPSLQSGTGHVPNTGCSASNENWREHYPTVTCNMHWAHCLQDSCFRKQVSERRKMTWSRKKGWWLLARAIPIYRKSIEDWVGTRDNPWSRHDRLWGRRKKEGRKDWLTGRGFLMLHSMAKRLTFLANDNNSEKREELGKSEGREAKTGKRRRRRGKGEGSTSLSLYCQSHALAQPLSEWKREEEKGRGMDRALNPCNIQVPNERKGRYQLWGWKEEEEEEEKERRGRMAI